MPTLTYEQSVAEIQKLPNGADIVEGFSAGYMEKLHAANKEAGTLRQRATTTETSLTTLKALLKEHEIDPDGDLKDQLAKLKNHDGLKPSSEFEKLAGEFNKFKDMTKKEIAEWKFAAEKKEADLLLEKAKSAFSPKLIDHFGKQASALLELALLKGQIVVKDGVPGVLYNDDFVPLNVEKGPNAIDALRKIYPEFAITKQTGGSKKPDGRAPMDGDNDKVMTRAQHDELGRKDPTAAMQFVKDGGTVTDE